MATKTPLEKSLNNGICGEPRKTSQIRVVQSRRSGKSEAMRRMMGYDMGMRCDAALGVVYGITPTGTITFDIDTVVTNLNDAFVKMPIVAIDSISGITDRVAAPCTGPQCPTCKLLATLPRAQRRHLARFHTPIRNRSRSRRSSESCRGFSNEAPEHR